MICTFERKLFESPDSGFCVTVFATEEAEAVPTAARSKYKKPDSLVRFTAVGYRLPNTSAIQAELEGEWKEGKYGLQLAVNYCSAIIPPTDEGLIAYLSSGLIKGIGEKTATAIVAAFGQDTMHILENETEKLLSVKGITEAKLEKISASLEQSRGIRDIVTLLAPLGITVNKAVKIKEAFGARAMDMLKTQPFELCAVPGFGFKIVDGIAKKAGCALNDPMRIRGALAYALDECSIQGHLFLDRERLCADAHELLNGSTSFEEVVSESLIEAQLQEMVSERKIISEDECYYLPKHYYAERDVAKKVCKMLREADDKKIDITKELAAAQKKLGITLSDTQAEAVKMCLSNNLSVITGGPGTGKTTVLRVILHIYEKVIGGSVLLTAPTGRAARRMAESAGDDSAVTLHKALGLISGDDDFSLLAGPLDEDFIIIDESSMIDMWLAKELFNKLPKGCKVLLVGDADQLPSVGPGNVLHELIQCGQIPVTVLDVVFRQADTSRIATNAHVIKNNNGKLLYGSDFEFIQADDAAAVADVIRGMYRDEARQVGLSNLQVLCPIKKTVAGVTALNEMIQALANPPKTGYPSLKVGNREFRLRDRVMQMKNKGDISNGDIGFVSNVYVGEDNDSSLTITFTDDREVTFSPEGLDIIDLSYAMTIHKSQGSEYSTVIIPMLMEFHFLFRNLLYTAITRAKSRVIIIGQKKALTWAIHNASTANRNTRLGQRIKDICKVREDTVA